MAHRRNRNYAGTSPRPLPAEIERGHLLGRIVRAPDACLIILAAPSGYGKTTLLGQLARTSEHTVWLTLGEHHNDLATLGDELVRAVTQVVPDADFARLHKARAGGAPLTALAALFARELDGVAVNLQLLLDQANVLNESVLGWLEAFALALGEGHQLVYCTYDLAADRLARPLASGQALLLSAPDLAFTEHETRSYMAARGSSADPGEVHREFDGWPAGIGLATAGISHVLSPDDLLEAAFTRLPRNVRDLLPEASVLEVWREEDAARFGCALPEGWLREARRAGLPLTPLSRLAYRPHTLVREKLEQELKKRPERDAELHARVADEALAGGAPLIALNHFWKAGRRAEAVGVAEQIIPRLYDRQEFKLICDLLAPLDRPENGVSPRVAALYGAALFRTGKLERSENLLHKLAARTPPEPLGLVALAYVSREQRDYGRMLELAYRALEVSQGGPDELSAKHVLADALSGLRRYQEALPVAQELVKQLETGGDPLRLAHALVPLETIHFHMGNFAACEQTIKRALALYAKLEMTDSQGYLTLLNNLANVYGVQGEFEKTLSIMLELLPSAQSGDFYLLPVLLAQTGYTLDALGRYQEAVPYYQKALELQTQYGITGRVQETKYSLTRSLRRSGDPRTARRLLDETQREGDQAFYVGFSPYYEGLDAFDHGELAKAKRSFEAALALLRVDDKAVNAHAYLLEIARQQSTLTPEDVEAFVHRLDAYGSDTILYTDLTPVQPLYRECVARGLFADRFAPFAERPAAEIAPPRSYVVNVRSLGDFALDLDGVAVRFPFAKVVELFLWLALHGPATREQIINALWDGSSRPKHAEYGKLALRRLRTSLAEHVPFNPLPYENRRYRLADELTVELDVKHLLETFEAGGAAARRAALEAYTGTFLPDLSSEWAEALRTRLHDAALAAALGLGKVSGGVDPELAVWAYKKAIALEPLLLDAHRALVQLLYSYGDEVGARLAYGVYARVMEQEYGEVPDFTLESLPKPLPTKHLN